MSFDDDTLGQIRRLLGRGRYAPKAYGLILAVVEYAIAKLDAHRHITGRELLDALVEFMVKKYGLLAEFILKEWGVNSSEDVGEIVFELVEVGLLKKRREDSRCDFEGYDLFSEIAKKALRPPELDLSRI